MPTPLLISLLAAAHVVLIGGLFLFLHRNASSSSERQVARLAIVEKLALAGLIISVIAIGATALDLISGGVPRVTEATVPLLLTGLCWQMRFSAKELRLRLLRSLQTR